MNRLAYPALAALVGLTACAPRGLYTWGRYEDSLYVRYVNHDEAKARAQLEQLIEKGRAGTAKVPPGVYADYGYLLFRSGDKGAAVTFFQKEAETFPEAAPLMSKLIARVQDRSASAASAEKGD